MENNKVIGGILPKKFSKTFTNLSKIIKDSQNKNDYIENSKEKIKIYEGNWKNDIPSFHGNYFLENIKLKDFFFERIFDTSQNLIFNSKNDVYYGEINDTFQYNGSGICSYSNQYIYDGIFKENVWSVKGMLYYKNNLIYDGHFLTGGFHGLGTFYYSAGNYVKYIGNFYNGNFEGKGKLEYKNGTLFEGSFKNGKKFGKSKITSTNGSILECNYINNKREGTGVKTEIDTNGKSTYFLMEYKNDIIISEKPKLKKPSIKKKICKCF